MPTLTGNREDMPETHDDGHGADPTRIELGARAAAAFALALDALAKVNERLLSALLRDFGFRWLD